MWHLINLVHCNNVKYRVGIIASYLFILGLLQVTTSAAQKSISSKTLTNNLQIKSVANQPTNPSLKPDTSRNEMVLEGDSSFTIKKNKPISTIDTLDVSQDSLNAPVKYKAQDSGVLIIATKEFFLYGKSNVQQQQMSLDAGTIKYNGADQTILAFGAIDSTDNPLNKTKMQDGATTTYSDSVAFNLKTQKGRTVNSYYAEGELFVNAQVLKKVDKDVFYGWKGRFTTCNLDVPHFAFRTRKLKMINNKIALSGPASPEIEGVPLPIGIPFGIYPLNRGRHSGVLAPQFVTSEDFGLGLQGLGYYKVINDNFDVIVKTDLYSYGGWSLNVAPKYIVRYKYQGGLNITFLNTKTLNRNQYIKEEFVQTKTFDVTWTHQRDSRARPGTTFGANVHFGSTQFNRNNIGNTLNNYQNRVNSSINYAKDFRGKANLSLNITHDQNAQNRTVNLRLPDIAFNLQTIYPFQKKDKIGKSKWWENIGIGYSTSFNNNISFYDSAISLKQFIDTIRWHATHNIPINVALPALGPVTISPSVSYREDWWDRAYNLTWNNANKKIDTSYGKAFLRDVQTSFGLSLNTRIFGTYMFKHSKNIKAIRHEIRPNVGFSYTPNLASRNNYSVQLDTLKHFVRVSKFTGSQVSNEMAHGAINFGISNLLEMKVKDKKDTAANATKKVRLIDVLSINSSYNLAVDSFALSPFAINFSTNLFEKINISANTTLDPYVYDTSGFRKDKYTWNQNKFGLGRLNGGSITIGTQLKSKPTDDKQKDGKTKLPNDPFLTPDEQQRQLDYARSNPAEFTDFNIPWTLSLNYSLQFTSAFDKVSKGFKTTASSNVSFNGDFNLSPKWKIGGQGYYSFTTHKLESLSFFISREMHCWQMTINVTPVNIWRSFSITISPKSGMLRDLKINRTRQFNNQ